MSVVISPSLLSADFSNLSAELKSIEKAGAKWVHLDVMDGSFVPNLSFGVPIIRSIRKTSSLFFDCHLMIDEPIRYVNDFIDAGADLITFHIESTNNIASTIEKIKSSNCKVGLSLKPSTLLDEIIPYINHLDLILLMSVNPGFGGQSFIDITYKIKKCKDILIKNNSHAFIQVDGGINKNTIKKAYDAGADVFVAGSAIFYESDRSLAIKNLIDACKGE